MEPLASLMAARIPSSHREVTVGIIGTSRPAAEAQQEVTASWLPGVKDETSLVGTIIIH